MFQIHLLNELMRVTAHSLPDTQKNKWIMGTPILVHDIGLKNSTQPHNSMSPVHHSDPKQQCVV